MFRAERRYQNDRLTARAVCAIFCVASLSYLILGLGGHGWTCFASAAMWMAGALWMAKVRNRRRPHWLEVALRREDRDMNTDEDTAEPQ